MKYIILLALTSILAKSSTAQVGIGISSPDASSIVDLTSTTKGFLPPRLTTSERDAINSGSFAVGLVIYNEDIKCLEFYSGSGWQNLCGIVAPSLPTPPPNIDLIPLGNAGLSSTYCFDIAESEDLSKGSGSLITRAYRRADFEETSTNTKTLTFTSITPVSNLTFYVVDSSGDVIDSFTPTLDYSTTNSLTEATAEIKYKTSLSSPDPTMPSTATALGKTRSDALSSTFYVVYQDEENGAGNEVKLIFSPSIRDGECSSNQTIASQSSHFLTSTGDVYSLGVGSSGFLGTGNTTSQDTLTKVTLPNPVISLVNGYEHSMVIDNTGQIYGWGKNALGAVKGPSPSSYTSPVNIPLPNGEKAIQLALQWNRSMVLTDANNIYGWGNNSAPGSLGTSNTAASYTSPTLADIPSNVTPVSIMNGDRVNFFLGDNGILYSSGQSDLLGRTATTPAERREFKEVVFPNNIKVHTVASTGPGAMAIGLDNELYVWGKNRYGELLYGTPSTAAGNIISTPQKLTSLPTAMSTPVQIFKGYNTTFILDDQNKLFASGWNPYGNLGTGSIITAQNVLEEVILPAGVIPVDVLTFSDISYVVAADGKVYSAGYDASNNLLQRTTDPSHPKEEFHLCNSTAFTNNTIIPN